MNKVDDTATMSGMKDFGAIVRRATLHLSLIYWGCMFVADSILGYFINIDPIESAPLKFMLIGSGALMTYAMCLLPFRMWKLSFIQKALLCFLMAAVTAPIYAAIDFLNYTICQYSKPVAFDPVYSGYTLIKGASMMFGWSCLFVAVLDNFEVLERERLLAAARAKRMVLSLSTFMRTTLSLDPTHDVPLAREGVVASNRSSLI